MVQITDVERQVAGGAFFPQAVLAQVAAALRHAPSDASLDSLRQKLPTALDRHAQLVAQQSQHLRESVMV